MYTPMKNGEISNPVTINVMLKTSGKSALLNVESALEEGVYLTPSSERNCLLKLYFCSSIIAVVLPTIKTNIASAEIISIVLVVL